MNKENFGNKEADVLGNNYRRYAELGGIINEKDYQSAIDKMNNTHALDRRDPQVIDSIQQVANMANYAKIELGGLRDALNPEVVLYKVLKIDIKPKGIESDPRLFREVLRILGDTDALNKLKDAYHTNRPDGTYCPLCHQTRYSENCP